MCSRCGAGLRGQVYRCACTDEVCEPCARRDRTAGHVPPRCARCLHVGPPDEFDRQETTNRIADAPPWGRRFG